MQYASAHGGSYATSRELGELFLQLRPDEGAIQLLGGNRRSP